MESKSSALSLTEPRLAVLYRVSRELASRLELDELLPRLLQLTIASVEGHSGSLMLFDARGHMSHSALMAEGDVRSNEAPYIEAFLEHGLAGWVRAQAEGVLIPNTSADPRWYQPDPRWLDSPKSVISVPLIGRERVVGVLTVGRLPIGAFVPDDLALLNAIAAQAGVAVENAQLFSLERRARIVGQTLHEVARTINGSLDLDQVLTLVLEQLARVVAYDSASILLRQGRRLRLSASRGFADPEAVKRVEFDVDHGLSARVVHERRSLVVDDVQRSDEWLPTSIPETDAIRAWIGAPLIAQDEVIGLLSIDNRRPAAYTEEDGQVVAAFAEQAAVAVLNARLYAQSEQRAYGLRALAATAQAINGTLELDEILRLVVRHAQQWLGMEGASLALVDGSSLIFKEAVGPVSEYLRGVSIELGAGIAGWVAKYNEPIIVPDVRTDPRFFGGVDAQTGFVTRALACVPVRIQNRPIGVIEVVNPASGLFDPETLEQLDSLASLAGTAIFQAQRVAELQAAENRFVGLFEDSIEPVLISDLDGAITDANRRACAFYGYSRAELMGLRITNLHQVRTDALTAGRYAPLLKGQPISYQTRIVTKAGRKVSVEVHAKLIERGGQQFIQWVQHDLSERLALEELRNDLMSMVVHDLRSPLGNIISSLDIMRGSLPAEDELLNSLLSIAVRAATRMSRLVDSLLDLRRLETGDVLLSRVPTDLGELLEEAVEQMQPTAAGKGIQLNSSAPDDLPLVTLDVDLIRRVLVNLLDNAVKYTPPAGSITLSVTPNHDQVTVSVRDNGPGISEADQQRIFNKFTRVQRDASPKGLGLGLAFCKLAVEAHGGRIWVNSQRERGTTFYFTLPIAGARPAPAAPAE